MYGNYDDWLSMFTVILLSCYDWLCMFIVILLSCYDWLFMFTIILLSCYDWLCKCTVILLSCYDWLCKCTVILLSCYDWLCMFTVILLSCYDWLCMFTVRHHSNWSGLNLQVGKPQEKVILNLYKWTLCVYSFGQRSLWLAYEKIPLSLSSFYIGNPKICKHKKKYKKKWKKWPMSTQNMAKKTTKKITK